MVVEVFAGAAPGAGVVEVDCAKAALAKMSEATAAAAAREMMVVMGAPGGWRKGCKLKP